MASVEKHIVLPMAEYIRQFRDVGRFEGYCRTCTRYGTCWACPPFDFNTDELLAEYGNILLFAVKVDVPSGLTDSAALLDSVRAVMDGDLLVKEAELSGRAFFAGTCRLCGAAAGDYGGGAGCTRKAGLPCRHPERVRPSLESFGFDIGKTTMELFKNTPCMGGVPRICSNHGHFPGKMPSGSMLRAWRLVSLNDMRHTLGHAPT